METHVYYPATFTTKLCAHKIRRTNVFPYVDDYGVKYFIKDDANHFIDPLKKPYAISTYWEGHNYLGLTIDWN